MRIWIVLSFIVLTCACSTSRYQVKQHILNGFTRSQEHLLLIVKVTSTQDNIHFPLWCRDDCIPTHFWFIHHSEVLTVIDGNLSAEHISFASLQHAEYIDEVTREWYVQLEEITDHKLKAMLGVNYRVKKHKSGFFDQ